MPTPTSVYQIGPLAVRIPGCPHPRLQGLLRRPVAAADPVTLELEVVSQPDWSPGVERGGDFFVKALTSHHCLLDFRRRRLHLRLAPELDGVGWYFVFRDIFAGLCGLSGDAFLHASAVVHANQATAFCAYSGGGKSTIAHLLGGDSGTISDEINWAFRDAQGQFRLVDQRFYRQEPGADLPDLPLAGVYLLVQAPVCTVKPADPLAAYPIVLAAPFGDDPLLPQRATTAAALFEQVPVQRLEFNLVPSEIRAALGWEKPADA